MKKKKGATRTVVIAGGLCFKTPSMHSWQTFLWGLLGNMQERLFWTTKWPELCPVLFSIPGGWLVVMPKVEPLSDDDWEKVNRNWGNMVHVPAELKRDSFGVLDGRIVAVDYGS